MLDQLPEPLLLILLKEVPQLALVNRKLFGLAELNAHTRLLSYYDFAKQEIDELAADVHDHMQFDSWRATEGVARSDYWIFGPEHVLESHTYGEQRAGHGVVYTLPGEPCGLQIVNGNTLLEYNTRLKCGIYSVYLDALVDSVATFSQTGIETVRCPHVQQHFHSCPSRQWLESQTESLNNPQISSYGNNLTLNDCYDWSEDVSSNHCSPSPRTSFDSINSYSKENESTRWHVGALQVFPQTDTSDWADVNVQLRFVDSGETGAGIVLNYLKLEPRPDLPGTEWIISSHMKSPSYGLAQVYRRASERKRRLCARAQNHTVENDSYRIPLPSTPS